MFEKKQKIRNENGKLICEAVFQNNQWHIIIKNRDCLTTLKLRHDGQMAISNCIPQA